MKGQVFKNSFRPYLKKHSLKVDGAFGTDWISKDEPLTIGLIERAIAGTVIAGYYLQATSDVFSIDIDEHGKVDFNCFAKLNQVVDRLGIRPSALFKSPRGLHAYWFLEERLPVELLKRLGTERLPSVEIRPTDNQSLSIPVESAAIDSETYLPLLDSFERICENAPRYHPSFLFGEAYLPETIRHDLRTRRKQARIIRALPRLHKLEADCLPFYDGDTNEKYCKLVAAYRFAGLSVDEAVYRFALLCEQSQYTYCGDLKDARKTRARVESSYRNIKYTPKPRLIQPTLFDELVVESVVARWNGSNKRRWPLRRFLYALLRWKCWHDEILKSAGETAFFDFLYKYYRKNRRAGYYPLPRNFLYKLNRYYSSFIDFLLEIGFLVRLNHGYSSTMGICYYYSLNLDEFLEKTLV